MCGIAGIISSSSEIFSELTKMCEIIRHRGPDDEGYVFFTDKGPLCFGGSDTPDEVFLSEIQYCPKNKIQIEKIPKARIAMGHRRLAIIDLKATGHQPMNYNNRFWITYNGEIYNYLELKLELEEYGYFFFTNSDTEVILAAYAHWGSECLSRFNGMWAFALYDTKERTLFLSRDRFGIKPLYYWISPNGSFAFASEIKQFTVISGWNPTINRKRVYDYLIRGLLDHTDETSFDCVQQLHPGQYLVLKLNSLNGNLRKNHLQIKQWYNLTPKPFSGTFNDASEALLEIFTDSVKLRLRSDVTVGSCLSGGLDSSSIVCMINKLLKDKNTSAIQKTFSALSHIPEFDESEWIEEIIKKTNIESNSVYPSVDRLFSEFSNITWHQDEPFGSTSIYAQWNVFHLAAENNVKVMLDGQGADELLAGYHGYFGPRLASLFKKIHWISLMSEINALNSLHKYTFLQSIKLLVVSLFSYKTRSLLNQKFLKPSWLNFEKLSINPRDPMIDVVTRNDSVNEISYSQLTASNLQMLLHWEDRNSMASSVEARVPFLDYRLVEFALGLPDNFKISNGVTKRILRFAMTKTVPNAVINRVDKIGFATPEEIWLHNNTTNIFRQKLIDTINVTNGLIEPSAIHIFDDTISGRRKFDFLIWRLINLGEWFKVFNVKF